MEVCVSNDYEQKQGWKVLSKSEDRFKQCCVRNCQRPMKSRFDEGKDFIEDWRSVTVELDDSIDDIAPGLILSSITTVALEPVLLLSDLSDMHPSRKDTLRNSNEMTARYEKDNEIEHALTMIHKDEYKDDGFFNEYGTFEFAKCSGCGGPKI